MLPFHSGRCLGTTLLVGVLAAGGLAPASAAGQVAWDSPLLVHPHAPHGWGVFLAETHPAHRIGVLATWRTAATPVGFGARLGLGEGFGDDLAVFGGVDASGTVLVHSPEVPLDLVWVLGAGLSIADQVLVSFPAALSAGWVIRADDVEFFPHVGPRVVLDAWLGDGRDDLDLDVSVDLGIDMSLPRGWIVRFGAVVGDRDAIAVGVTLPTVGRR